MKGRYTTLSHCWGPQGMTPLRTTKANLDDHLNSIALEKLPRTFQDAIRITRGVGLEYLWIDSLCILQDDQEDWLQESARMGSIYEKGWLTIAASAARNSTEGCFRSKRPEQCFVEVPYHSTADETSGSFFIATSSSYESSPAWGPLRKRAWAVQEWRLSRRIVHFTEGGLSWKCKTCELDERDDEIDMEEYPEWDSLVQNYSDCELTNETDRLIALQGLVNEMQMATLDRYYLGIWTSGLPDHLLWMRESFRPNVQCVSGMPSWTWASKPDPKVFWSTQSPLRVSRTVTCSQILFKDPGIVEVSGILKRCTISTYEVSDGNFPDPKYWECPEGCMRNFRNEPIHYIQGFGGKTQDILGLAALDGRPCRNIYCLFLMSSERPRTDPLNPDFVGLETSTNVSQQDISCSGSSMNEIDTDHQPGCSNEDVVGFLEAGSSVSEVLKCKGTG